MIFITAKATIPGLYSSLEASTYAGVQPAGAELMLAVRIPEPITIEVPEMAHGLPEVPGITIRPRPADIMPALSFPRDPTIVRRTFTY